DGTIDRADEDRALRRAGHGTGARDLVAVERDREGRRQLDALELVLARKRHRYTRSEEEKHGGGCQSDLATAAGHGAVPPVHLIPCHAKEVELSAILWTPMRIVTIDPMIVEIPLKEPVKGVHGVTS